MHEGLGGITANKYLQWLCAVLIAAYATHVIARHKGVDPMGIHFIMDWCWGMICFMFAGLLLCL